MTIVRKIDLARALGVNRSTITKAAQAGRLVLAGDDPRFFDLDASLARYQATKGGRLDVQERYAAARAASAATDNDSLTVAPAAATAPQRPQDAATAPAPYPTSPQPPATPLAPASAPLDATGPRPVPAAPRDTTGHGLDRTALAAARLAAENAITKMDLGLLKGSRLLLADVGRESQGLGARLFDHLHRVVDQFAARLAAAPEPAEQARLLHRELHQVARAFDRGGIDSLRRLKAAGRSGRLSERDGAREDAR